MLRGLYTSGLGMQAQMNKMDVVANNIANADTAGFKRDSVATQSFTEELLKRLHDPAGYANSHDSSLGMITSGLAVDNIYTDFSNGNIRNTGDRFNAAISGTGFFVIRMTDGTGAAVERYTRDGSFTLNAQRVLISKDGSPVLGQNGVITVPDGEMTIEANGSIVVDGVIIDALRLVNFENPESLRKYGINSYDTTPESVAAPFTGVVRQGFLEDSNVNTIKEMMELISTSRVYEANQRMVTSMDAVLGRAVNDVGRKA